MSEPRRLLSDPDGATPFERDLLESWSAEQPSAAARTRALGIASAATLATAGVTAGAGALAPKAASVAGVALVKWLLVGMAVAAAVTAAVVLRTEAPAVTPAATTAQATVAPIDPAPTLPPTSPATSTEEIRAISPADLKSAPALPSASAAARPVATAAATATVAVTGGSLPAEIAALDRARKALEDGDVDQAIGLVDAYEARFPTGTFAEEAEVLRVEALVKRGDRARAASAGQRFLAAHPTSPHAARIRAILPPSTP